MNVFLDTNILISAVLNGNSTPAKAFIKAVSFPNRGLVCKQNIDEMRRIFKNTGVGNISFFGIAYS